MNFAPFTKFKWPQSRYSIDCNNYDKNQWNQTWIVCVSFGKHFNFGSFFCVIYYVQIPVTEWTVMKCVGLPQYTHIVPTIPNNVANIWMIQCMLRFVLNAWKNDQEFVEYSVSMASAIKNWYWKMGRRFNFRKSLSNWRIFYVTAMVLIHTCNVYKLNPKW